MNPKPRHHWAATILLAIFGAAFLVRVVCLMSVQSPSVDEVIHIPAGYGHWRYGDFSLNPEHPPVAKLLSATGLVLFAGEVEWRPGQAYRRFFHREWDSRTLAARLPLLLFSLAVILVLAALLARLFDPLTAALSTAALTLYTTFVAHAVFVHTDVPAALFYLAACALVLCEGAEARPASMGLLAAVLALGFLTKFSLVVMLPTAILALLLGPPGRRVRAAAAVTALTLVVVPLLAALAYAGPLATTFPVGDPPGLGLPLPRFLRAGWWVLVEHNRSGHHNVLFMETSREGWRSYFPLAYLLKTPLSILITTVVGGVALARQRPPWLLPWLAFVAAYWAGAVISQINIGVRHLLPVAVVMWVALAAGVRLFLSHVWGRVVGAVLFLWLVVSSALHWNGELAAFGELAWGRPGWRYLADSNVDWGQQVSAVASYARRHELQPLYVDLMTPFPLSLFGAEARSLQEGLEGRRLRPGYYAVSAHQLAAEPGRVYDRFRALPPVASFGDSVFLYRIERRREP